MTITCLAAWVLALLLLPILFIAHLTESQPEQVRRLHRSGMSQRRIAQQLGISRHRVAEGPA